MSWQSTDGKKVHDIRFESHTRKSRKKNYDPHDIMEKVFNLEWKWTFPVGCCLCQSEDRIPKEMNEKIERKIKYQRFIQSSGIMYTSWWLTSIYVNVLCRTTSIQTPKPRNGE